MGHYPQPTAHESRISSESASFSEREYHNDDTCYEEAKGKQKESEDHNPAKEEGEEEEHEADEGQREMGKGSRLRHCTVREWASLIPKPIAPRNSQDLS